MLRILALVCALFSGIAGAVTTSIDYTDMWWNPNESGWGVNMTQQEDTIFLTLYVYDPSGRPTWFVAPNMTQTGVVPFGDDGFEGPLYSMTGPYFGASSFNPQDVGVTQVGSVLFTSRATGFGTTFGTTGGITYSVNGVTVIKLIQRQTWRTGNLAGLYHGATTGTYSGCPGTSTIDNAITLAITQTGTSVILNETGANYSCSYAGTLTQSGKLGTIVGTRVCPPDTTVQDFTAWSVQAGQDFVSMALNAQEGTCFFIGRIGGMRR